MAWVSQPGPAPRLSCPRPLKVMPVSMAPPVVPHTLLQLIGCRQPSRRPPPQELPHCLPRGPLSTLPPPPTTNCHELLTSPRFSVDWCKGLCVQRSPARTTRSTRVPQSLHCVYFTPIVRHTSFVLGPPVCAVCIITLLLLCHACPMFSEVHSVNTLCYGSPGAVSFRGACLGAIALVAPTTLPCERTPRVKDSIQASSELSTNTNNMDSSQ